MGGAFAQAAEYYCPVGKKNDLGHIYSDKEIGHARFSVRIAENLDVVSISRCSFSPSQHKVTCDKYVVDKVVFDEKARIKKLYVFRSQFDVQIFSDLFFIENNGRGGISYGKCQITAL